MKTIEPIQSAKLAVSPAPFSTGVKANGFLFLSGQVGIDQGGKLADDFDLEVRQIFKRLNDIYKTYFNGYYPSRTCIAVLELPLKANVEMTITASTNN